MSEAVSDIKAAEIYSDLSRDDIAELMAEGAKVDALFQSGRISTMYLTGMAAAACAVTSSEPEKPVVAA